MIFRDSSNAFGFRLSGTKSFVTTLSIAIVASPSDLSATFY